MSCEDVMLYKGCMREVRMEECAYQKLRTLIAYFNEGYSINDCILGL